MFKAPRFWYRKHSLLAYCLSLFSVIYRMASSVRRHCYRWGICKTHHFRVPIIVVGNLTVGGTGKTPLVIWLVNWLKAEGYRPGIVSRGYRGANNHVPVTVHQCSDVKIVGDEALLLRTKTDCPMVIGVDRPRAVKQLLASHDVDIVVSDDGLQHYALNRSVEIVVVDGDRQFGNRFCLPAGPLREPLSRLKQADFIITNRSCSDETMVSEKKTMKLIPTSLFQVSNRESIIPLNQLKGREIHAVAGIGNPSRFFKLLEQLGAVLTTHVFPDHHVYRSSDLNFGDAKSIIMTEKDAVKCHSLADDRLYCLAVAAELSNDIPEQLRQSLMSVYPS